MKPFRLGRWGSQVIPLATRPGSFVPRQIPCYNTRLQSSAAAQLLPEGETGRRNPFDHAGLEGSSPLRNNVTAKPSSLLGSATRPTPPEPALPFHSSVSGPTGNLSTTLPNSSTSSSIPSPPLSTTSSKPIIPRHSHSLPLEKLPSPHPSRAPTSAKLYALHARLNLPSRLPLETFARTLVDKTADPDTRFNNSSFSALGNDLLGYYMGEHLICNHPRLPMPVIYVAQMAYVGPTALASVAEDWGIEVAAEPGGEVNPGLLQFRRMPPGTPYNVQNASQAREVLATRPGPPTKSNIPTTDKPTTTLEHASANFVRSVLAGVYLHAGAAACYSFFTAHVLSRRLDIASLFTFTQPTRDLSRLCAREGFDSPVARVISETGRLSRTPVFVVGVFSGRDKLGEAAGSSLNEARFKASVNALKGWYLYTPKPVGGGEMMVPSMMEGEKGKGRTWRPAHIDDGEVIV